MFPNLSVPIRNAIVGNSGITALLEPYKGSFPVFTRVPVPDDCPSLCIVISQDINTIDQDGINDQRVSVTRDIVVSGENPDDWRVVSQIAKAIAELFHRQKRSLTVSGWHVVDIRASSRGGQGSELDQSVSAIISLEVRLAAAAP